MVEREELSAAIEVLVDKYQRLSPLEISAYNEENTKNGFILPLFGVLGWDVTDESEVSAEHPTGDGRVDYTFKINGVSRFFLEAKPLRDELAHHPEWVKRAVSYAYNKGIPWVVLTNFKELWVFAGDAQGRRFLTLSAEDYLTDIDKLLLLSKSATEEDLLRKEAVKVGVVPPEITVEKRLYQQLRTWREELFKQLHEYDKTLPLTRIDEIIQRLFNRLIFIRTCEDRRLEDPVLMPLLRRHRDEHRRGVLLVEGLRRVFRQFDGYYDSDLFDRHMVDQAHIDDGPLETILAGLYQVPGALAEYDFSLIDADILGRVYEQYLGHVSQIVARRHREMQLRLDRGLPAQQAMEEIIEVVEAPQRRKERGIYYTPKWVVHYIVRQTVARFIEEHKDRPDAIHQIKILDPACGSGSFLIRAYDELLRWHAAHAGMALEQLTQEYRMPILRENVFGVDLDQQAVEIARLNLLLRALARRERLPTLADNVKRGNSLISGEEAELRPYFGDGWRDKQPFDWEQEFANVMEGGGFDVVIGNPPYVRIQSLLRAEADYYRGNYESAFGSFDIYVLFIERGLKLLRPGGRLGFITSGKFLKSQYGKRLQALLNREATVEHIVDLSSQRVFAEATTYPAMIVLRKGAAEEPLRYQFVDVDLQASPQAPDLSGFQTAEVPQSAITGSTWPPPTGEAKALIDKLASQSEALGSLCKNVFTGLQTSADNVYVLEKRGEPDKGLVRVYSKALDKEAELEIGLLKPLLSGKHIDRFFTLETQQLLLFPYRVSEGKAELISVNEFEATYRRSWEYLRANREALEAREGGKMRHERWYAFGRTQSLGLHDYPKLAIPRLVRHLQVFCDSQGEFYLDNVDVGGVILKNTSDDSYKFVLGLLNSKLLDWYFRQVSAPFRGDFRSANRQFIEPLPIRRVDLSEANDKAVHDRIVRLVEEMLELQKRLAPLQDTPCTERDDLMHAIALKDSEIDNAVYDLYGLTEAERRLVEEETARR